ncbi:MAG: hypothetical protein K2X74_10705 [Acetobacteraceae bacterium]|nr:hypothetical protein [Acetobacteraceae bacterium]
MRALIALLSLAALLPGCAQQQIEKELNAHVGRPVATLIARLDYPDRQTRVAGRRAYIWGADDGGGSSFLMPALARERPATLTGTAMTLTPVDQTCQIRVIVDSDERVMAWESRGNQSGCAQYARRLVR